MWNMALLSLASRPLKTERLLVFFLRLGTCGTRPSLLREAWGYRI